MTPQAAPPESAFEQKFKGLLYGVLQWHDLDALWQRVLADPEGWYASLTGTPPPEQTLSVADLKQFIGEVDALLHREHEEKYCGIVYADDLKQPSFIKIYDPHNLGSSCGVHTGAHPPRWLLSRQLPVLIVDNAPLPNARKRWWQAIFG